MLNQTIQSQRVLEEPVTRLSLSSMRTRALRKRVWYRVLNRMERGLVDLTIRWVDKVKNRTMTRVLLRILEKLEDALDNGMVRILEKGRIAALRLSQLATTWNDKLAFAWRYDQDFAKALGFQTLGRI